MTNSPIGNSRCRWIALLTDFGLADPYAGVLRGVIAGICPDAAVIDLTHGVPPRDVRAGAFALLSAWRYFPEGTIFVAVVDPGVGTARRAIAARADSRIYIGPDNGLLSWALDDCATIAHQPANRVEVRALTNATYWLPTVSATFHGRDVFAPVAGHLCRGTAFEDLGQPIDDYVRLPPLSPRRRPDGSIEGEVIVADRFGNLITSLRPADLTGLDRPTFTIGARLIAGLTRTYADASAEIVALVGSDGFIEIARPNGSAAALLDLGPSAPVVVRSTTSAGDAP